MKTIVYIAGILTASIAGGQWATDTWAACTGVSLATYNGNWVAAMAAAKMNGNLITVPAGTWPSPQILPYAGLTIRGAGAGVSFVTRNGPGIHTDGGVFKVTVPNVTITDLTVRGWPVSQGPSDDILINGIGSPTNLTVQRVNLENAQGIGIQTESAAGNMTGGLFEDINITNTMFRYNGAHGVALWLYKGTSNSVYRRIHINGARSSGIALDAGTTGDTNARSNDNNVFQDITIANTGGTYGGILITGAKFNSFTNVTITDISSGGPAIALGADQSGLTSVNNSFKTVTLARITSTDFIWGGATACGNIFDTVGGSWIVTDPGHCNTYPNSPGLVIR